MSSYAKVFMVNESYWKKSTKQNNLISSPPGTYLLQLHLPPPPLASFIIQSRLVCEENIHYKTSLFIYIFFWYVL